MAKDKLAEFIRANLHISDRFADRVDCVKSNSEIKQIVKEAFHTGVKIGRRRGL